MSTLTDHLLAWFNWYIPDEPEVTNIEDVQDSPKLMSVYKKLLPPQLQPSPEDPLSFVYTAVMCLIKSYNHGPDKFMPPPFSDDKAKNQRINLLNLFMLYKITQSDKVDLEDKPSWWDALVSKFEAFDSAESTETKFPLDFMAVNFQKQVEEKQEEIKTAEEELKNTEIEIQQKVEKKQASFGTILQSQNEELLDAENNFKKLTQLKSEAEARREQLKKANEEAEQAQKQLEELTAENEQLTKELEQLKSEEKEMKQIQMDLTGMELLDLKNKCEAERQLKAQLEKEESELSEEIIPIDYTERDQLKVEIETLQKKVDATNPDIIKAKWNQDLDNEITNLKIRVEKLQQVLELGNDFLSGSQ